jgi:hypothetical protein
MIITHSTQYYFLLANTIMIRYNNEQIDNSNATTSKSTGYNTFAHVSNSNTNGSKTIRDNYAIASTSRRTTVNKKYFYSDEFLNTIKKEPINGM